MTFYTTTLRQWFDARWLRWTMLLGWMALIFIFSHQPTLPHHPAGWFDTLLKKGMHAVAYATLFLLWYRALQPHAFITVTWATAIALGATLLYAASDEWHQTFVPGRHGSVQDVLIDTAGALVAALIVIRTRRSARDALSGRNTHR